MNLLGELRYQIGDGSEAKLQFSESVNSFSLDIVFVPNSSRGKGVGTILIRHLLVLADALGKSVYLTARPIGTSTSEAKERLVRYYRTFGFTVYDVGYNSAYMVRQPPSREPGAA